MSVKIHPTAIVNSQAKVHKNCRIDAYAIIEKAVEIGDDCHIEAHAIVKEKTILGKNVKVGHFSVIGGNPQHLDFDNSIQSNVLIEDRVRISEGVTIHRSIYAGGMTKIGFKSFLMGNSHVGHDSELGKEVVLANGALLGGHASVGDYSFIGGGAGVHQFTRIGKGVMVGGLSEVSKDIPPYVTVSGRNQACGLNLIGMKRREFTMQDTKALKLAYTSIMMKSGKLPSNAKECLTKKQILESEIAKEFSEFFLTKGRGFVRSRSLNGKV